MESKSEIEKNKGELLVEKQENHDAIVVGTLFFPLNVKEVKRQSYVVKKRLVYLITQ